MAVGVAGYYAVGGVEDISVAISALDLFLFVIVKAVAIIAYNLIIPVYYVAIAGISYDVRLLIRATTHTDAEHYADQPN